MKPYYEEEGIVIYHADCREVLPQLGNVDLIVTDPPYGIGMDYGDGFSDTTPTVISLLISVIDIAVQKAPVILTTVGCFAIEKALYVQRPPVWRICWRKGITSRPSAIGFTDWEPVFVYGTRVHRNSHDLFTVQPEKMGAFGHPCPKPEAFYNWLIQRFSEPGGTVLDPFNGSGTALRVAKDMGRRAIGIEIEERYCEIAAKRLSQGVLALEASA